MLSNTQLQARIELPAAARLRFMARVMGELAIAAIMLAFDWSTTGSITWSMWPALWAAFDLAWYGSRMLMRVGAFREHSAYPASGVRS